MTGPKQNGREEAGAGRRLLFSKMILCAEQTTETTKNADLRNHTLFSAVSGLKMGSTSVHRTQCVLMTVRLIREVREMPPPCMARARGEARQPSDRKKKPVQHTAADAHHES